jgi:hypothetical protein
MPGATDNGFDRTWCAGVWTALLETRIQFSYTPHPVPLYVAAHVYAHKMYKYTNIRIPTHTELSVHIINLTQRDRIMQTPDHVIYDSNTLSQTIIVIKRLDADSLWRYSRPK